MLLFSVLLIITCLVGCRVKLSGFDESYLSLEKTNAVRGICAVLIVLHHITLTMELNSSIALENGAVYVIKGIGFLLVTIFLFYTGYGLAYSFDNKPDYTKNLLQNKFAKIVIPYFVVNVLYFITKIFYTKRSFESIITDLKTGHPIADNSWYIVAILFVYLAFWFSYRFFKNKKVSFGVFILLLALYTVMCIAIDFPDWWYKTMIIVPLGMVWYRYRQQILGLFKSKPWMYYLVFVVAVVVFILLYNKKTFFGVEFKKGVETLFSTIISIFFIVAVELLLMKVTFNNYALRYLGSISFEIYMMHGLFIRIFKKSSQITLHSSVYVWLVLSCSIISAYMLYRLFNGEKAHNLGKSRAK